MNPKPRSAALAANVAGADSASVGHTGGVSLADDLLEERRLRRRAGDPRLTPEDRALLLRLVRGDLAEEFADSLDAIAAADPALSGNDHD